MNVQNIPKGLDVVKRAFVPRLGAFSFFDFQKVEPTLTAYFLDKIGRPALADLIRAGVDPYTAVAELVTGSSELEPGSRDKWKITYLSLLYGGGVKTIQAQFSCGYKEARGIIDQFHTNFPDVRYLQERTKQAHARRGHIRDPWGRELHMEEFGEHKLLNKLIQGSAADLMKSSLLQVDRWLRQTEAGHSTMRSRMVSVVHDEIIIDGPVEEIELLHKAVPYLMCGADERAAGIASVVPLGVDHEVALTSWADKMSYSEWKESHVSCTV